jgi:hypothetical protein
LDGKKPSHATIPVKVLFLTNRPPWKNRPARGRRGQAFFKLEDKINLFFVLKLELGWSIVASSRIIHFS